MKKLAVILTICAALLAAGRARAINIHELNGSDLGMGVGSRAIAMGGAFTGLADDPSALYWNPAGITQLQKNEAMFMVDTEPTRYSFKALVLRPEQWKRSRADWSVGIAATNRLKYIADGDWGEGNAGHLIDLSMINVERNYVGGLNSRTNDLRITAAGKLRDDLSIGTTYVDFECVTTFYDTAGGRTCQIVAYEAFDFGVLWKKNARTSWGLSLRNPFEETKPRYLNIGMARRAGRDILTLDIERVFGQYGTDLRQVRFLMLRGGMERDYGSGWKGRAGIIVPLEAKTTTLGNLRSNLPSPKFTGSLGAGYAWKNSAVDFALYGDPGRSYIDKKAHFSYNLTLRQKF